MDELKSAPRGYPKDHPRIDLLRRKGLMVSRCVAAGGVAAHEAGGDQGAQGVADAAPDVRLARRHVGPSTLPPENPWDR